MVTIASGEHGFHFLLDIALDEEKGETERGRAVRALGDLGDGRAIDSLLTVHDRAVDDEEVRLAIEAVVALATLGNHDKAQTAIDLAGDEDPTVRVWALPALQSIVGPGLLAALRTALKDEYAEMRLAAERGLFYLGVVESIEALIPHVEDESPDVANDARVMLHDITGDWIDDDADVGQVRSWWEGRQAAFKDGICYRLGQPIELPPIIELLAEPMYRYQIIDELRVITGQNFGFDPTVPVDEQDAVLDRARSWWEREGYRFQPGRLYKYGYAQDIARVY